MIAAVKGIVELLDTPYIIIDVNGVGYKVLVASSIFSSSKVGEQIKLFTYTHVREDTLELYGFLGLSDLKLFEQLLSISGIGPKTAIGIFTLGSANEITQAIVSGDAEFFTGVPRLGRKNAQKIIIELKGKFGEDRHIDLSEKDGETGQIVSALRQFGFSNREAIEAVRATKGEGENTEEKIRMALKYLGK